MEMSVNFMESDECFTSLRELQMKGVYLPVAHGYRNTWNGGGRAAYIHIFLSRIDF